MRNGAQKALGMRKESKHDNTKERAPLLKRKKSVLKTRQLFKNTHNTPGIHTSAPTR
jgi:hypothetical protein